MCHYPGADYHQSSTIPPWPMCVTIQGQTATSHQPFHLGLCVSLSRGRLPPVINHSTLAYVCHYPEADCHQSSTIPPWPMCVTIQGPPYLSDIISQQMSQNSKSLANIQLVDIGSLHPCIKYHLFLAHVIPSELNSLRKWWAMRGNNA